MTELEALLLDHLESSGPVSFAAFQETALYHPEHGYYSQDVERSGWRGHFLTSAELDPAFGALWAIAFRRTWESLGKPDEFEIVEIGPGEGGFARAVLDAAGGDFADALSYRLVERLPKLVERQMARLSAFDNVMWSSSIEEVVGIAAGCIFANEVLDNLPVHLLEQRGGALVELFVAAEGGELVLRPDRVSDPALEDLVAAAGLRYEEGHRVEVGLAAIEFTRAAAKALRRGNVVLVDYGVTWAELERRPSGTLLSYSSSGTDEGLLERPGEKDITSHANWDLVRGALEAERYEAAGPTSQAEVLRELGLGRVEHSFAASHRELAAAGRGAEAVRALSRHQAL
ncbi:MAG: SAM-dependent methyltransferase, partial [Actinomycetota bacterium]|nr:SAM-dependent methyltransferase [Actinomycetota bacterium]